MIPDFVSHYYLPDRDPFLSLSDLGGNVDHAVFDEMLNKHKNKQGYNRRFGKRYLEMRMNAERKLKYLFESRGGRATREYPVYFVLGTSKWFKHLNSEHQELRIPIADLPRESVSVTFPDSFVAMTSKDKCYYERIYFIDEIDTLVSEFGLPEDKRPDSYESYWSGDFELYIEVQIWDDVPLRECPITPKIGLP